MSFWNRLDQVAEQHSALRHPFYVRWSDGALSVPELAYYAGQYRHAVIALAEATAAAARSPEAGEDAAALAHHAVEEAAHIELWDEFVAAVGGDVGAAANEQTRTCATVWQGGPERPLLHTLVAMFAIESAQPAISATKRAGLAAHYGIPSAAYFEVHEARDVEHAAEVRGLIEQRMREADQDAMLASAEDVLKANLVLLDGVS